MAALTIASPEEITIPVPTSNKQINSQAFQIGGGSSLLDPIDLNVEVKYTEKHFVDPRDLPPALAAL